uniref:CCHC-type domain-containing protein n=1 Tax=Tanacetum cinerariifolium TaxID=118510 RepID=A0A6L2J7U2_TANCI|nr:hypothetical protein [Tanacetum cinerariifolium]
MDEAIQVSCIIDKLPPSLKDFKHTLKHKKEELTLVELGSLLRIEESLWAHDGDKPKGNNVVGPQLNIVNDIGKSAFMLSLGSKCGTLKKKCGALASPEETAKDKGLAGEVSSSTKKKGRTVAITAEDMQKRKNDVKARTTLLLDLPDEYQLRFCKYDSAKELWEAILKTFGGNEATKKIKKNQLKQQYGNFKAEGSETLEQTFNRDDLDTMSLDDVYNHLKVYEPEEISQIDDVDIEEMDIKWNMALLSMRAARFWKKTGKKITIQGSDVAGFDKSKVECFNCHKMGHFARECRSPRSQDRGKRESYKNDPKVEEPASNAMTTIGGIGWDWIYMAEDDETSNNHALVADAEETFRESKLDKDMMGVGFNEYCDVPPPHALVYSPPKKDLSWMGLPEFVDDTVTDYTRPTPNIDVSESVSKEQEERWKSNNPSFFEQGGSSGNVVSKPMIKFVKESGCPNATKVNNTENARKPTVKYAEMHMTGNISYLSEYEPFNGGYASFGDERRKITSKGSIKTDFKLVDDKLVLLKTPRQQNMYTIDLKNVVPHKNLTCLIAKASVDESMLWHRRLGHLNFKTMNKLVRSNLVKGLPSKSFENEHFCVACLKGKQHKASYKSKLVNSVSKPLHTLHIDLFGPTSNGVAEIRNRTLIEAARTVLADDKLPITFWAEAVNTDCYVQNRVLVIKPHNKTPHELFNERSPAIGFLRPFRCYVMIFNTLDHLGKFDAKGDEGYFVGYSLSSKSFRVFNKRTKKIEENLHVDFLENKSIKKRTGPDWLFDIDTLTNSMNYVPVVVAGTSSTNILGTKEDKQQEVNRDKEVPESSGNLNPTASIKVSTNDSFELASSSTVETKVPTVNTHVPTDSLSIPLVTSSVPRIISKGGSSFLEPLSLGNAMSFENRLEDFFRDTSNAVSLNEVEADLSNMETAIQVSLTPTLRIHKDHPKSKISGPVDTHYCLFSYFLSQEEPKKIVDALKYLSWVEAMQQELLQFKIQNVWVLVDCPSGVRPIRMKWVLKNKKDKRGIVIRNKARLVAQGHTQEEGIDYEEVFAPVTRIEAIRLFLAYASYMGFTVYQMDVKSAFLYETIDEEVYVMQPIGFQDPEFPHRVYKVENAMYKLRQAPKARYGTLSKYLLDNGFQRGTIDQTLFIRKHKGEFLLVQVYDDDIIFGLSNPKLCREFKALMHDKFQMSAMDELNFFLGLQVLQIKDGIFLSQDKYVGDILKNFRDTDIRAAKTPMDRENPWGKDMELYLYRSMIKSLMYLKGNPKLGLWYLKESPFDLVAYSNSDYGGANQDRKSTTRGCQFLGRRLISWQCKRQTIVATSTTEAEYVAAASGCGQVLWIKNQLLETVVLFSSMLVPQGDVRYGEAFHTDTSLDAGQDRENIAKTSAIPYESLPRVTSLGDGKGRGCSKHGGMDQGEDLLDRDKSGNKGSDNTDEMSHVLGTLGAANILASRGLRLVFTTASLLVATASTCVSPAVTTASGSFPTPVIFTIASVATPTTRVTRSSRGVVIGSSSSVSVNIPSISKKDKRKGKMTEPEQPSKEMVLEKLKLDRSNQMVAKYLSEYEQAKVGLSHDEKVELINDLLVYQRRLAQIKKYQGQQNKPALKSERRNFYMSILRSNAGWKAKDFKGMTFKQIKEKFIPVWEKMQDFVPMNSKLESERLKRQRIQLDKERIKKLKTTEALSKEPTQEQYTTKVTNEKAKELWVELKRLYEPDTRDLLWALQRISVPTADVYIAKKFATVEDFAQLHEDKIYS